MALAMARGLAEVCYCAAAWEPLRQRFVGAVAQEGRLPAFRVGLAAVCSEVEREVISSTEHFLDVSFGSQWEVRSLARAFRMEGSCLPVLAVGAYSCLVDSWLEYNYPAMNRFANIASRLFIFADGCFEPGVTRWKITAGQVWRQVRDMIMGEPEVDWRLRDVPSCIQETSDPRDTLIGHCGNRMPHEVRLAVAGPLEPILADELVLCTHTSADSLALVIPMLKSWEGPASVAVFEEVTPDGLAALQGWVQGLAGKGISRLVVSVVGQNKRARSAYDKLYPANLLRQAAVDAAVGRLVLLADPGFVPSAGFHRSVGPSAPLGMAVRALSAAAPTAFAVASFVVSGEAPEALGLADLGALVESGDAVSFDLQVCRLCRPFAWQWLLLLEPLAKSFQALEPGDLHHPAWLLERSLLPRLPGFLHGLVGPWSGVAKIGWSGLPSGLKASAAQLQAQGAGLLLLPGAFLHRRESLPLPKSQHWEDLHDWFPLHYFFDILLRRVLAGLRPANRTSAAPRSFLVSGQLVEVFPARSLARDVVLLKQGSDPSLTLVVMASTVLASGGLELLLSSVPWTVHGVALGAKDYWAVAMEKLPPFLRAMPPDSLVAILDAYDVVLFPCSRSITEEYAKFGKAIVWAADKFCFPNPAVCRSCEDRYPPDHPDLEACRSFPNVNGGCYMGTAPALAHALEWMRWHGAAGGRDDQENKWHYYNHFPDRVALDHGQRIFSCFFGSPADSFRLDNCSVVGASGDVCIAHANGGTKFEILAPLMRELEARGCVPRPRARRASVYAGISYPRFIWW